MPHYTAGLVPIRPTVLLLAALAAAPTSSAAGDKVGPETCKACHPAAFEAWRTSPHARARESLGERHAGDARCLSCHAPDAEDGLAGVTCEACHGAGRMYAASYVMRDPELARLVGLVDPGEKTCAACHTDSTPSLTRFDYPRKLALIAHGEEPAPAAAPAAKPGGKATPGAKPTPAKPAPPAPAAPPARTR
jgi:Cytochrome c554 and c-prime